MLCQPVGRVMPSRKHGQRRLSYYAELVWFVSYMCSLKAGPRLDQSVGRDSSTRIPIEVPRWRVAMTGQ